MLDLDLEITGRPVIQTLRYGEGEGGEGGLVSKKFFSALRASVSPGNRGGGGAGPPGPSPGSATVE